METAAMFECESTLTERYQTTVPSEVRAVLKLGKGDKLRYSVSSDAVVLKRATEPEQEDPVLTQFLAFVANDLAAHPERARAIDAGLRDRIHALVGDVDVDLEAPLSPADE